MAVNTFCPGSIGIKQPKPEYHLCPSCGYEVEIWTDELRRHCPNCHTLVVRGQQASCIDWCQFAEKCIGTEAYQRLKKKS